MEQETSSMQTTTPSNKLPGVMELLKSAWTTYKRRWPTFLGITALPFVVTTIVGFLGLAQEPGVYGSRHIENTGLNPAVFAILMLITIIAILWSTVALVMAIKEDGISIGESYRKANPFILPYIWVNILVGLLVLLGLILLIIPGILFAFWYSLSQYILLDQNVRGMQALRKSKEYMKGNIGAVFWRGLAGGILIAIPIIVLSAIITASSAPQQVENVLTNIISFTITPIGTVYAFYIYKAVKAKKESEPQQV